MELGPGLGFLQCPPHPPLPAWVLRGAMPTTPGHGLWASAQAAGNSCLAPASSDLGASSHALCLSPTSCASAEHTVRTQLRKALWPSQPRAYCSWRSLRERGKAGLGQAVAALDDPCSLGGARRSALARPSPPAPAGFPAPPFRCLSLLLHWLLPRLPAGSLPDAPGSGQSSVVITFPGGGRREPPPGDPGPLTRSPGFSQPLAPLPRRIRSSGFLQLPLDADKSEFLFSVSSQPRSCRLPWVSSEPFHQALPKQSSAPMSSSPAGPLSPTSPRHPEPTASYPSASSAAPGATQRPSPPNWSPQSPSHLAACTQPHNHVRSCHSSSQMGQPSSHLPEGFRGPALCPFTSAIPGASHHRAFALAAPTTWHTPGLGVLVDRSSLQISALALRASPSTLQPVPAPCPPPPPLLPEQRRGVAVLCWDEAWETPLARSPTLCCLSAGRAHHRCWDRLALPPRGGALGTVLPGQAASPAPSEQWPPLFTAPWSTPWAAVCFSLDELFLALDHGFNDADILCPL